MYKIPSITDFPAPIQTDSEAKERIVSLITKLTNEYELDTDKSVCELYATLHNTVINIQASPVRDRQEARRRALLAVGLEYILSDIRTKMMFALLGSNGYDLGLDMRLHSED